MRVDREKLLTVVAFAVDESDKQLSRSRAQNVLQNAGVEVIFQLVAKRMLDIFQRACIAAAAGSSSLLQLVVGRVGKAQHHLAEVFAELVFLGQQLQHFLFRLLRRYENEIPIPGENRTGDFAIDGSYETQAARAQVEGS